jgi:hypothetical protein
MIGWACVSLMLTTNEGSALNTCHIGGVRANQIAIGSYFRIEWLSNACLGQRLHHCLVFLWTSITKNDLVWLAEGFDVIDPLIKGGVLRHKLGSVIKVLPRLLALAVQRRRSSSRLIPSGIKSGSQSFGEPVGAFRYCIGMTQETAESTKAR